jgi:hypothetical protein
MTKNRLVVIGAALAVLSSRAESALYSYYVGTDNAPTLTSGTYTGQPNPNYNRLTFLLGHTYSDAPSSNHFHRLGAYALTGSAAAPVVFFSNDRVPEGTNPALPLQPGIGVFEGKLVSAPVSDSVIGHYSHLEIAPVADLKAFNANGTPNEPEDYLYNASAGRYSTTSLAGTDIHFQLVSLTAGLNIGSAAGVPLFANPGDEHHLGDGDSFSVWNPWFWTDATAAPGIYSATFKLTDEAGLFGDSGEFRWEFQVVPEPGSGGLLAGLAGLGMVRRRRTFSWNG